MLFLNLLLSDQKEESLIKSVHTETNQSIVYLGDRGLTPSGKKTFLTQCASKEMTTGREIP